MKKDFYHNYFNIEKEHWLMVVRRQIVKDNLNKFFASKENIRVLDFGCGGGLLVDELERLGYGTYGVDNAMEAIEFGSRRGVKNLGVISGERIEYPDNTFDAVLALDVLEHIENENWALKEFNRVLKPGGVAIIMVPAFMFLWGVQDEVSHHFRRYDQKMLKSAIVKSEVLNIMRISYFNFFLFFPIALIRVGSRLLGLKSKRQSDFDINSKLMNRLFYMIFNTERKLLKFLNYPFGVSILAVLKKNKA